MLLHHLKKRGRTYYVRLRRGGTEQWISTHQHTQAEAITERDRILARIRQERTAKTYTAKLLDVVKKLAGHEIEYAEVRGMTSAIERAMYAEALPDVLSMIPTPPTFAADLWERYMAGNPKLAKSTMTTKKQRFSSFAAWAGKKDMRDFSRSDALRFLKSTGSEKAQTWKNYISDLSSVWQASPDIPDPWKDLRAVATATKDRVCHKSAFTLDQMREIKDCIEKQIDELSGTSGHSAERERQKFRFWHFFLVLSYYSFCRLTDAVHFSAFCIRKDGFLDFSPLKTQNSTENRRVVVEITPQLQREIDALPPPDNKSGYFFPDYAERYDKNAAGRSVIDGEFLKIIEKCGISRGSGYGTHSMRHGGITQAIDADNAPEEVAAVAGHSVRLTTGTYYHGKKKTHIKGRPEL